MAVSRIKALLAGFTCLSGLATWQAAQAQAATGPGGAGRGSAPSAATTPAVVNEIVVTAQRRQELSRDVPITVTTLDASRLAAANVDKLSDITRVTPGIRFDSVTNFVQPTIRGIGTAVNVSGGGSNVGIYVDGFYNPNPLSSDLDLANVSNVQVLKGPQGTLFGRNTTGGAILVTTADPSVTPGGMAEATYGRFNSQRYRGYVTGGLNDKVAVDLEGDYRRGDGFQTNIIDGDKSIGQYKNWFIRTGVKAQVSDNTSILLRYTHSDINDNTGSMTNPYVGSNGQPLVIKPLLNSGLYTTDPDQVAITSPHGFLARTDTVQATVKVDLGIADLTSYTQYRHDRSSMFNDFDFTAAPIFDGHLRTKVGAFSQEFLATSKPGGPLQWTAGLFYFNSGERWDFANATTPPEVFVLANNTRTQTLAGYVDATYQITPQIFLTAGGRISHDIVSDAWFTSTDPGTIGQTFHIPDYKNNHFTPRVVVRYKPTDQSSVYASYTQGYKAGLLNVGGEQFTPVRPETISAFEVGYKYGARALSFDISAFYYKYQDLQVSTYFENTALISNAAKSRIYGLDSQARYQFPFGLVLNAGATYTESTYLQFNNAPTYVYCADTEPCAGTFKLQAINIVNGAMQRAPKYTANVGANYPVDMADGSRLAFSGNLYYTSSFFFDPSEQFLQKGYEVLALRVEWTDPSHRYKVAVFGDNLTGNRYRTQLFFNNVGIGNSWSAPATWGISVGAHF